MEDRVDPLNEHWRAILRRFLGHDIPDDMAACFECDVVWCPDERFEECRQRLANAAERRGRAVERDA
jgi:hypothetical protein